MRKILIIKTSSLGDVIHMLPAITDAIHYHPRLTFDWVVEEGFAEAPAWHPAIKNVIPVAIRRWRKHLFNTTTWQEIGAFRQHLQAAQYDAVIDAQGLVKSALLAWMAQGKRYGYDRNSIREPIASLSYQRTFSVSRQRHAITRNRLLLAHALDYTIESLPLNYGVAKTHYLHLALPLPKRYIVALHGTSRIDKEWPESCWRTLIQALAQHDIHILLPWGNQRERERAGRLLQTNANVQVLPRSSLNDLAAILQGAIGVIGMDTGLMHIAAALDKPGLALYPATEPELTGILGNSNSHNRLENLSGAETQDAAAVTRRLLELIGG
ncbi:lipopolysaccharide heptosyltransferase I [Candidatus Thiothrix sp. Deng01]|uniref:Lipopolysaccharide heptosyltransferase 1 n=1 Tax=Candidatus Thiothrix phosphatis TaxID=3112415 RepID=A0ABU6D2X5_9GAMM|nr:lipopolysaccharide heptosyltransferase I [Candidatus Thiothrix sp. Deng01]MEB4593430.1 lipopolysaccharide heptosyltransferase I [Candidatus Thiothrix sp. Deng01]